jgi:hypothetical protein
MKFKIAIGNRAVIGQRCGYGYGNTASEAIADAIAVAGGEKVNASYDPQTNMVWFDGRCLC